MNRIPYFKPENSTSDFQGSYRGKMVIAKRPKALLTVMQSLMMDQDLLKRQHNALGGYLQYRTITQGGVHAIELISTNDEFCRDYELDNHHVAFESWLLGGIESDNLIIDKATLVFYANPKNFDWEFLQNIENKAAKMGKRDPRNLKVLAEKPKNLSALRETETIKLMGEMFTEFETLFREEMIEYLDYGHLMSPEETTKHCQELKITLD